MRAFTLIALLGLLSTETTQAITLKQKTAFVDDIVKALAESDKQEEAETKKKEAPAQTKTSISQAAKKEEPKNKTTLATKKEVEDVQMDNEAVKAYSNVIAEAAEDSEPATPVTYTETDSEKTEQERMAHAPRMF